MTENLSYRLRRHLQKLEPGPIRTAHAAAVETIIDHLISPGRSGAVAAVAQLRKSFQRLPSLSGGDEHLAACLQSIRTVLDGVPE